MVSVVIPTYNRAHSIASAIQSALDQDFKNIEIIIVDDGSKDDTDAVISKNFDGNPRVRYIKQKNGGVSSARNRGMREAKGKYVALLDSDDTWIQGKLTAQIGVMEKHPEIGMSWTDMNATNPEGKLLHRNFLRIGYETYKLFPGDVGIFTKSGSFGDGQIPYKYGNVLSPMVLGSLVHTSTVIFTRALIDKIGLFEESLRNGEDYIYFLKAAAEADGALIDHVFLDYRIGAPDALTVPLLQTNIAKVFLDTIEDSMVRYKDRIQLPAGFLRKRHATALAWLGRCYIMIGEFGRGRKLILASLAKNPFQPQQWKELVKSIIKWKVKVSDRLDIHG